MTGFSEGTEWNTTQNYESYSQADHETWNLLSNARLKQLSFCASAAFLRGFKTIRLAVDYLPDFADLDPRLSSCSGWHIAAVKGFLPSSVFFHCLANRIFPSTTFIRPRNQLDYITEPDIFHDIFGHIPMYAEPRYAAFVQQIGELAQNFKSNRSIELLARIFWFTVEFGLIWENGYIKVYGSGLLSSASDCATALSARCQRLPFELDAVLNQPIVSDQLQTMLFVIESYDQLSEIVSEARQRLLVEAEEEQYQRESV